MAYTASVENPPNRTGQLFLQTNPDIDPAFNQVLPGNPFLAGSTFAIEEYWQIVTRITKPSLVSSFKQYSPERHKLGNWTIADGNNRPYSQPEYEGFLHYTNQRLVFSSTWTIGLLIPDTDYEASREWIDNCSYATWAITPPVLGSGFQFNVPFYKENLFALKKTLRAPILDNFDIKRKAPKIGLYLFEGVELVSANYGMGVVNVAPVKYEAVPPVTCVETNPTGCAELFAAYISENTNRYRSRADCEGTGAGEACVEFNWVCPSDPSQVYTYYVKNET